GQSEWQLSVQLLCQLAKGCLLLADRLYGCAAFAALALDRCQQVQSHFLIRVRSNIKADERRAWGVDQTSTIGPFGLTAEYLEEHYRPTSSPANFNEFVANGYYVQGSYYIWGRKLQLVSKWESFNPGQANHDNLNSITGGLNYYILGDNLKVMLDYIHTWSDFRQANPAFGKDAFDEALLRMQVMF
ncbi:MAG: OprO/OprP family phosphate-selective porin, partial [Candidatus Omnitrophica bacterium]|nr:OprO/OprP family phosphate-selective porin [Candidatus Omnitrophota bacterium]